MTPTSATALSAMAAGVFRRAVAPGVDSALGAAAVHRNGVDDTHLTGQPSRKAPRRTSDGTTAAHGRTTNENGPAAGVTTSERQAAPTTAAR